MSGTKMNEENRINIAVIQNDIKSIKNDIQEIKNLFKESDKRQDIYEKDLEGVKTKMSAFQVFQTTLTIMIGAIASYLGIRK